MRAMRDLLGYSIVVRPRWTVPINMRLEDKPVLDAALIIAKEEGTDITKIFRMALLEFVRTRAGSAEVRKIDEFLDKSAMSSTLVQSNIDPCGVE